MYFFFNILTYFQILCKTTKAFAERETRLANYYARCPRVKHRHVPERVKVPSFHLQRGSPAEGKILTCKNNLKDSDGFTHTHVQIYTFQINQLTAYSDIDVIHSIEHSYIDLTDA